MSSYLDSSGMNNESLSVVVLVGEAVLSVWRASRSKPHDISIDLPLIPMKEFGFHGVEMAHHDAVCCEDWLRALQPIDLLDQALPSYHV